MSEPVIEFIAKAMIQYDKNNENKRWSDLARVAYNATILYFISESEKINESKPSISKQ